jgi:hypothetical protein
MANKNKKLKETVYRDKKNGDRWRFLQRWGDDWMVVRIKDGHRLILKPESLTLEK